MADENIGVCIAKFVDEVKCIVRDPSNLEVFARIVFTTKATKQTYTLQVPVKTSLRELVDQIPCSWQNYLKKKPSNTLFIIEDNLFADPENGFLGALANAREELQLQDAVFSLDTTISSLTLKLNTNYYYIHDGCCQHVFVIQRLQTSTTEAMKSGFETANPKLRRFDRHCRCCETHSAVIMTLNAEVTQENPSYLCQECMEVAFPCITLELVESRMAQGGWCREWGSEVRLFPIPLGNDDAT